MEEKASGEKRDGAKKTDGQSHLLGQVKQEVKDGYKLETRIDQQTASGLMISPGAPGVGGACSSATITKVGSSLFIHAFQ